MHCHRCDSHDSPEIPRSSQILRRTLNSALSVRMHPFVLGWTLLCASKSLKHLPTAISKSPTAHQMNYSITGPPIFLHHQQPSKALNSWTQLLPAAGSVTSVRGSALSGWPITTSSFSTSTCMTQHLLKRGKLSLRTLAYIYMCVARRPIQRL